MDIDWKTGGSVPIYPDGAYRVKIKDWEITSASTGTPQVKFTAEIQEPEEFAGQPIMEFCPLTEASLWRLANFASCIVDVQTLPRMEVGSPVFNKVLDELVGSEMIWYATTRVWNGQEKQDIKEYKPIPNAKLIQMDFEEDLPSFLEESEPTVGETS